MHRAFVSPHHDDWDKRLDNCEFAYNDSINATTGFTPFQLNYGRHPRTPLSMYADPQPASPEPASAFMRRIREDRQHANDMMHIARDTQARYANMGRRHVQFEVGQSVYLATDHVRLPEAANCKPKFLDRFMGPYRILEASC